MKSWFPRLMLVLIFVALVANIVVAGLSETGEGVLGPEIVKYLAFGVLVIANLCIAGAGIYFTTRTRQKSEKTSALWGRRGFGVNIGITLGLAIAPFFSAVSEDAEGPQDPILSGSLLLLLFGVSNIVFLYAFYRDYLRTTGSRRSRTRRYRSTEMAPSAPPKEPAKRK
ncbi:MAG: hypothetical protein ACYTDY_08590 [Planctomycetota bacterium]|jgi:membrane protease YdiL (CAAX protease family)